MKKLCLLGLLSIVLLVRPEQEEPSPDVGYVATIQTMIGDAANDAVTFIYQHPVKTLLLAAMMLYVGYSAQEVMRKNTEIQAYRLELQQSHAKFLRCQTERKKLEDFIHNTFNPINQKFGLDKLIGK